MLILRMMLGNTGFVPCRWMENYLKQELHWRCETPGTNEILAALARGLEGPAPVLLMLTFCSFRAGVAYDTLHSGKWEPSNHIRGFVPTRGCCWISLAQHSPFDIQPLPTPPDFQPPWKCSLARGWPPAMRGGGACSAALSLGLH